jgi:hypothetical protein
MTLADFRSRIEAHSPGSLITRDWLIEQLDLMWRSHIVEDWVDSARASEITGESPDHLRARASGWRGQPNPPIRVSKNDAENHRSRWLFAEEDCWRYARENGVGIASSEANDPDDPASIAEGYLERIEP